MTAQTTRDTADPDIEPPTKSRLAKVRSDRRLQALAAGLVLAAGLALILWSNRGSFFYLDDWDFAILRTRLGEGDIFGPQNQNWHVTTLMVYYALLKVFGFGSYVPFRLASAALLATIALLGYLYARQRVGAWWALAAISLIVFNSGTEIALWPFQIGQLVSIASGIGALLLVDREPRAAVLAGIAALLLLAVVSSSAGIPMLLIVIVDRFLCRGGPRCGFGPGGPRLALLATAPALLLYAWWNHKWAGPNPNPANLAAYSAALSGAIDAGQNGVQRTLGLFDAAGPSSSFWGQIAFAALVILTCARIFGPHPADRRRIIAVCAGLVGYWVLLSWGRANVPGYANSPRYLFITQVLLVLLAADLGKSVLGQHRDRLGMFSGVRGTALASGLMVVVVLATVTSALHTSKELRNLGYVLRIQGWAAKGQSAAIALLPPEDQPHASFFLDPASRGLGRPGSMYLDGLKRFGTDLPTEAELRGLPVEAREFADGYLLDRFAPVVAADQYGPDRPPRGTPPTITQVGLEPVQITPERGTACVKVSARSELGTVSIPIAGATNITNTAQIPSFLQGRRYAPGFSQPADLPIPPKQTRRVGIRRDQGSAPWSLQLRGSASRICAAPTSTSTTG